MFRNPHQNDLMLRDQWGAYHLPHLGRTTHKGHKDTFGLTCPWSWRPQGLRQRNNNNDKTNSNTSIKSNSNMAVCQNLVPLVNIKIAGKWMFIPLKMVLIGIDPYPYYFVWFGLVFEWLIMGELISFCVVLMGLVWVSGLTNKFGDVNRYAAITCNGMKWRQFKQGCNRRELGMYGCTQLCRVNVGLKFSQILLSGWLMVELN